MSTFPRLRGAPPKNLTGQKSVKAAESQWWNDLGEKLESYGMKEGDVLSIEEIASRLPAYPTGGRPRPRTASRRLRDRLELVERGPNGSRGRGATYRILPPPKLHKPLGEPELLASDDEWLLQSIEKMTGGK